MKKIMTQFTAALALAATLAFNAQGGQVTWGYAASPSMGEDPDILKALSFANTELTGGFGETLAVFGAFLEARLYILPQDAYDETLRLLTTENKHPDLTSAYDHIVLDVYSDDTIQTSSFDADGGEAFFWFLVFEFENLAEFDPHLFVCRYVLMSSDDFAGSILHLGGDNLIIPADGAPPIRDWVSYGIVPEPATGVLMAVGAAVCLLRRRRKKQA